MLNPVVEVRDPRGRRVRLQEVRVGNDPVVAFHASQSGDYTLSIANVSYRGGPEFVYRMTISKEPYVAFTFPTGQNREPEFLALTGGEGFRTVRGPLAKRPDHLRSLEASTDPGLIAQDNSSAAKAMKLSAPVNVTGRFLHADSEDWYSFTAKRDEAFTIACRPFPATSAACPILALEDQRGRPLARVSGADSAGRDCRLEWKAPAAGSYRLRVRDLQYGSRGGEEFIYRLSLRPAQPGFSLTLAADYLNVLQGGKADVDALVERTGGFTGPIDLNLCGLPAGVRIESTRVPESVTRFKLVFATSDDTRPTSAVLRISGAALG